MARDRSRGNGLAAELTTGRRVLGALAATLVAAATLVFEVSPAQAGLGMSVGPDFPSPVTVTQTVTASVTITNTSNAPDTGATITVNAITLVPSCGQAVVAADCPAGSEDPDVYQLSATGTGAAATACAGTTFTITNIDQAQDKYQLTPGSPVLLPGTNSACKINFTATVLKVPTKDALGTAGIQTADLAFASGTAPGPLNAAGFGSSFVTVNPQAQPTIGTQATSTAAIGQPISDTATLAGGNAPTGTITFRAFGPNDATCAAAPAFTSGVAVDHGNGAYNSGNFTPTVAGTYRWTASYGGDVPNAAAASGCNAANETSAVNAATPAITTQATPAGAVGGSISDTATLTLGQNPTGTITFRAFAPGDATCANPPAFTSAAIVVNGNGNYNSGNFSPTTVGTYRWTAAYTGDTNNAPIASPCNAANESSDVTQPVTAVTTQASAATVVGGTITDTATLTGGVSPTGTIQFRAYGPNDATCATAPIFTSTKTVTANGPLTSDPFTVTAPGTYRWIAFYSGGGGNPAATTACNDANESVQVAHKVPTLVTDASDDVVLGGAISDTATLSDGFNPTGSITFNLFGPNDGNCDGTVAFTATKPVAGNGTFASGSFTPTKIGAYRWVATYTGDANNTAITTACNDPAERARVNGFPTVLTTQASPAVPVGSAITDTATLSGGQNPTGEIVFLAYGPDDARCTPIPDFTSVKTVTGNGNYTSDPFTPTKNGVYRWIVVYNGDNSNEPAFSGCDAAGESTLVGAENPPTTTTLPGQTTTTTPPPPTTAATTTTVAATTVTTRPQNPAVRALVVTGAYAVRLARIALILLVVGMFAVVIGRRPTRPGAGRR